MKIALFRIIEKRNINVMEIAASSILDILSLFKIPTSSIQELWNAHCERKLAESRDILFDEITGGNFNNIADDDKISLMHRYTLAAMNGTARLNLRLLAKAINSIAKGEQLRSPIYANEFNRYAQILETLSDEEIIYQENVGYGGSYVYALTPFFDKIIELVDFQDALDKENG